ncbi:Nn.00g032320.m01.CDS01 [Neocucurbitaria sp. VM-36]
MLKTLNIPEDLPAGEQLQRLINAPEEDATAAMSLLLVNTVITLSPCDDGMLIAGPMPRYSKYVNFKTPDWCKRIMIDDVKNKCMIWNKACRAQTASRMLQLTKSFPFRCPGGAEKIIELYDLRDDISSDKRFWKIEKLCTNGLYTAIDWIVVRAKSNI